MSMSNNDEITKSAEVGPPTEPVDLEIVVTSTKSGREVQIKGAIGQGGELDLIDTSTPYRKRFRARSVIAMFESLDRDIFINVKLYGDIGQPWETDRPISAFMGPHGGIAKNFTHPKYFGGSGQIYG